MRVVELRGKERGKKVEPCPVNRFIRPGREAVHAVINERRGIAEGADPVCARVD